MPNVSAKPPPLAHLASSACTIERNMPQALWVSSVHAIIRSQAGSPTPTDPKSTKRLIDDFEQANFRQADLHESRSGALAMRVLLKRISISPLINECHSYQAPDR
jgi:hypothetical protein